MKTSFSLLLAGLFSFTIYGLIDRLDPASNKISDMELSDLAFAYGQSAVPQDSNIVIINTLGDTRAEIAGKLLVADSLGAKVIGIDIAFLKKYDYNYKYVGDSLVTTVNTQNTVLINALRSVSDKLVLAYDTESVKSYVYDSVNYCKGYVHTEDVHTTKRKFQPVIRDGDTLNSFSVVIAKKYRDIEVAGAQNSSLIINYRHVKHNIPRYDVFADVHDMRDEDFSDKIVLLGVWDSLSNVDKYYTPLNGHLGRSQPDMYGIEYHAQILSMLIAGEKEYVKPVHPIIRWLVVFVLSYIFIWWSNKLSDHSKLYAFHDIIMLFTIIICTIIGVIVSIVLLDFAKYKLEPMDYVLPILLVGLFKDIFDLLFPFKTKPAITQI